MQKKLLILGILLATAAFCGGLFLWLRPQPSQQIKVSPQLEQIISKPLPSQPDSLPSAPARAKETSGGVVKNEQPAVSEKPSASELVVPSKAFIKVPFIVQAPFADWNDRNKEACEEASVLMVHDYLQGVKSVSQQESKDALNTMLDWGETHFSGRKDTTIQETADFFIKEFGYSSKEVFVVYDITLDDIKAALANGYPVIVPAAGRSLGNKYFRTPGPLYHMLVIVGYDADGFITNDPGTIHGEGYRYKPSTLFNAIHDLTDPLDQIDSGRKAMLIVKRDL